MNITLNKIAIYHLVQIFRKYIVEQRLVQIDFKHSKPSQYSHFEVILIKYDDTNNIKRCRHDIMRLFTLEF